MLHTERLPRHEESALDERMLEQARALAREPFTSYAYLRNRLEQSGLLAPAVEHVQKTYEKELSDASFLTHADWEMLGAVWLYDEETFMHSIDTYRIAYTRMHRPIYLPEHSLTIDLSREFSREGVTESQFLRACLLHDIGKLAMPIDVLTNHITDDECARIIFSHYDSLEDQVRKVLRYSQEQPLPQSAEALLQALRATHTRPQSLAPVRLLLSDAERLSAEETLTHLGLSLDDSLLTIMRVHDTYSRDILAEEGLPLEAELAGAHHRHQEHYAPTPHTITIGTLQVSVDLSDIIHLADVTQAMKSQRHYKRPESSLMVMATLVAHATYHQIDPFVTYLWVDDEFNHLSPPSDLKERAQYKTIQHFLATQSDLYRSRLLQLAA